MPTCLQRQEHMKIGQAPSQERRFRHCHSINPSSLEYSRRHSPSLPTVGDELGDGVSESKSRILDSRGMSSVWLYTRLSRSVMDARSCTYTQNGQLDVLIAKGNQRRSRRNQPGW